MKYLLLATALLSISALPAHAMTEDSSHYQTGSAQSHYADPDDSEEQFNDAPRSSFTGQSGRESELLQGGADNHPQTYGFSGYDNSWTQSRGYYGSGSGFYGGVR